MHPRSRHATGGRSEAKLTHATAPTRFLPRRRAASRWGPVRPEPSSAATLRAIAQHGPRAFYEGDVAADMVATLRAARRPAHRGGLRATAATAAEFVEPDHASTGAACDVWQCPPNGQGCWC
jgi:gamma-glutamyltranspeptidase/glutathione hydrolase